MGRVREIYEEVCIVICQRTAFATACAVTDVSVDAFGSHVAFLHGSVLVVEDFLYSHGAAVACSFRERAVVGEHVCPALVLDDCRVARSVRLDRPGRE